MVLLCQLSESEVAHFVSICTPYGYFDIPLRSWKEEKSPSFGAIFWDLKHFRITLEKLSAVTGISSRGSKRTILSGAVNSDAGGNLDSFVVLWL